MTSLLFVSCRAPFLDNDRVYPPLAGLYLKSYVAQELPDVKFDLIDDYDLDNPEIFTGYDYVGISIMTPQKKEASKILEVIKMTHPEIKVIAGGPHVKHYTKEVISEPYDYVVPLDGERPLVKILKGTEERVLVDVVSPDEMLLMPPPDRLSEESRILISHYSYSLGDRKATTLLTARGCPNRCAFCEDAGTKVRRSSIQNIIQQLDDIKALGFKGVYIFDDLFAMSPKLAEPICRALKERDLIYRCNGHAKYMTEDFMKLLAETGCFELMFGAESGSQKILDNINKRTTIAENYEFVRLCNKYGIVCKAFLMLGLPGETEETIKETEEFIKTSGIDDFQLSIYFPYKGTMIKDSIDRGETVYDLIIEQEGSGAYGKKGGSTESNVRTSALTSARILEERNRLVDTYKPDSHKGMWKK
jgi:anaerobic magnesium-protoporphyrin IX monomethyl ester cyclase